MQENNNSQDIITFSTAKTRWLSNFYPYKNRNGDKYPEVIRIECGGVIFDCSENAYQAAKTTNPEVRERISHITPFEAKEYWIGKESQMRPDWHKIKDNVMFFVCFQKFLNTPSLRNKLVETGSVRLIEGNDWGDQYWGVVNGVGLNKLGKTLERIRYIFQAESPKDIKKIAQHQHTINQALFSERKNF